MFASALLPLALIGAAPATSPVAIVRIDPTQIADDDFSRHRDATTWAGLTVEQIDFREERATWRLFRIADPARPTGPLWFVPHDNENAGFEAALVAIRRYGGTIVAVDAGVAPGHDGKRLNEAVTSGRAIDPNRNFHDGLPLYPSQALAALAGGAWPIIALHTNSPGYDPNDSRCPLEGDTSGSGIVSIRYCDDVITPSPSIQRAWPFDDDDTVAFATYLGTATPKTAFCQPEMVAADFNVLQERVMNSDGSLSNYAVLHHLAYLNFETQDRGLEPQALAGARDRLLAMIDAAMAACGTAERRPVAQPPLRFR